MRGVTGMDLEQKLKLLIKVCIRRGKFRKESYDQQYCTLIFNKHESIYCPYSTHLVYVQVGKGQYSVTCPFMGCSYPNIQRRRIDVDD